MNMNLNTISVVENSPAENNNIIDSHREVEIWPITIKNGRRMIVREIQDEYESVDTMADWTDVNLFTNGSHTLLSCPSYRLLNNMRFRLKHGDHYCTNYVKATWTLTISATGNMRVRMLLDYKAPNGDLTHTREHLHWSLLTARPILWRSLMLLINQSCPDMYTPADKPQISSYRFGMPHSVDEGQLKKLFPCLSAYFWWSRRHAELLAHQVLMVS